MPQRYAGRILPASLYALPFDYLVALILVAAGVFINVFPLAAPASIRELPEIWSWVFRVMCLSGGLLAGFGLVRGRHRWSHVAEMVGMALASGVFATYSVGLIAALFVKPGGILGAILLVGLSFACLLRALALNVESQLRLKLLVEAGEIQRRDAK